ncbi:MAG: acyltransferase family protein [Acidimicrobiales bacterium]
MTEPIVGPVQPESTSGVDRLLPSGNEAGTAPGDRAFRPDVEGLRAVAILLVVLFHSGVSVVSGGYVGVDVFFVISGFVITGVLLRERASTGRTSILSFYGRRCRRIIPAATLVIIAAVGLAYWFLGVAGGIPTASDGRWAAVFLANFHFIATGTNYLASQQPPSPLQNFWSLAVEEQFYLVYPTLFLLVAGARVLSLRARLAVFLVVVICVSFAYSAVDTHSNPVDAFFSPFTRAWELALGALVAVCTPWLLKAPARLAGWATWLGFGAIIIAACAFDSETTYPGSLVTIPVVGAALIIAGGMNAQAIGAEALLGLRPFRWLGRLSYSLYLWHWPILIIAAEYAGKTSLSVKDNLGWDVVALTASVITYRVIENPARHAKRLRRARWASIGLGVGLVAMTLVFINIGSHLAANAGLRSGSKKPVAALVRGPSVPLSTVLSAVAASNHIKELPSNLNPPLREMVAEPRSFLGNPPGKNSGGCSPAVSQITVPACTFGDLKASRTMVLDGDSHAGMWFRSLNGIAIRTHWKLVVLFKDGCPASLVPVADYGSARFVACDQWHRYVVSRIKAIKPDVLIISQQEGYVAPGGVEYTTRQWQRSLEDSLTKLSTPKTRKVVVIGNLAAYAVNGPDCLARHTGNVQACSDPPEHLYLAFNTAEERAAKAVGANYIDVIPWFCARRCSPVIGNDAIYWLDHVTVGYSLFLEGVLAKKLDLPTA